MQACLGRHWLFIEAEAHWAYVCMATFEEVGQMGDDGHCRRFHGYGCGRFSLVDFLPASFGWSDRLLIFVAAFVFFEIIAVTVVCFRSGRGTPTEINNTDVEIRVGDLFSLDGVKVIPFDEYFDTDVYDKVISRNSLNGIFISRHAGHIDLIKAAIDSRQHSVLGGRDVGGRPRYRLGTIKSFVDYALLPFMRMDELNRAHLERGQYEECLLNMWDELDRMYAGRRIVLPLLGSGITWFKSAWPSEDDLMRCMLCTLRVSVHRFSNGVLIELTKKTADKMRLYDVKDCAEAWQQGI